MRDEVSLLVEKSERSILAAEELIKKGFFEFAVSRLYYAMFYCAEALLLSRNLSYTKHSAVISAFGKELVKSKEFPEEFHSYLVEAFKQRQKADYLSEIEFSKEKAVAVLRNAKKFLEQTEKYLKVPRS